MDFLVKLNLLSLPSAEVIDRETDSGGMVRGVFIPFENNLLTLYNKGKTVSLWLRMTERLPNPYLISHSIKPNVPAKKREEYIEMNGDIPYVGDARVAKKLYKFMGQHQDLDDILDK